MINYVLMNEDHVAEIAEIEKICFSDPWSVNSISSELGNPLSLWLVAEEDGVVAGYVGSQTVLGGADMMNLAVLPQYRKQGIGEALVVRLMEALRTKGAISLSLEVRQSNLPAISLYKKLGFEQIGLRPNYYRNPKENALILRKEW